MRHYPGRAQLPPLGVASPHTGFLAAPVDIASLAALRVLFGLVMSAAALRFLANGWVNELLLAPTFHFTYGAFPFVRPLPGPLLTALFSLLALAALGMAVGFYYRVCAGIVFFGFSYIELIDKAIYLNHYYLVSLLAALLFLLPAGRAYSLDAWRRPEQALQSVPTWVLGALRLQVGVVYFFAGVAKLNADWLFGAQPLRIWLSARADTLPFGSWLAEPAAAYAASWLGAAFDLSIVFLLLSPKTRKIAFLALAFFHALTAALFPIGIFPWLMTAAATIFLDPAWSQNGFARLSVFVRRWCPHRSSRAGTWREPRWLAAMIALHCAAQLILPLRRFAHPSNSAWTQRGFNFGWNVMVAEKAGQVTFRLRDRGSGRVQHLAPDTWLAPFQQVAMAQDPDLVRQAAEFLAHESREQGREVEVFADAFASLNGRPSQRMLDPTVDLARPVVEGWILPLE